MLERLVERYGNKYFLLFIVGFYYLGMPLIEYFQMKNQEMITMNELIESLEEGKVYTIHIEQQQKQEIKMQLMNVIFKDHRIQKTMIINNEMAIKDLVKQYDPNVQVLYKNYVDIFYLWDNFFKNMLMAVLLGLNIFYLRSLHQQSKLLASESINKSNSIFNMGKSKAKLFKANSNIKVRFKDVAGMDNAKLEISEFVDFLQKPQKYQNLGAKIPKGAILSGPPGTGKTMLAKACAGEAGVPFFYVSGSEFVEVYVGVGAARVRDLFKQAKKESPSIIFIDEIDAIGRKRESGPGGNDEKDNTLNQLLVEMDGFDTSNQVVVISATNRKELLDSALIRPGRFDRNIEVNLPDLQGRKDILMVHLQPLKLDQGMGLEYYARRIACLTPGMSGAELSNLCNEAAIIAARQGSCQVNITHFEMASDRIIGGIQKRQILDEDERRLVAIHESGHAVASWFLEHASPLLKITIIPRAKGSLGFAQYLPNENSLQTKEEILEMIVVALGGRCSEKIFFNDISNGAYDDLQKVYRIAYNSVVKLGFSDLVGNIGYEDNEFVSKISDQQQDIIDQEVNLLIKQAEVTCNQILIDHKHLIQQLADQLLEKETLDLQDITSILGERPFKPKKSFQAYLDTKQEIQQQIDINQLQKQNQQELQIDNFNDQNNQKDQKLSENNLNEENQKNNQEKMNQIQKNLEKEINFMKKQIII